MNNNTTSWQLIWLVRVSDDFGIKIEPRCYVLDVTGLPGLQSSAVYSNTLSGFFDNIEERTNQLFRLFEETDVRKIENRFSPAGKKKKTIKELLQSPDLKKLITQYHDSRIGKLLQGIKDLNHPIYLESSKGNFFLGQLLNFSSIALKARFYFTRKPDGVLYKMVPLAQNREINLQTTNVLVLNNEPGWILLDGEIFPTSSGLNGNKFKPFLNKPEVFIPASTEKDYFKKFILKAVKNQEVEADGFSIIEKEDAPKGVLSIIPDLKTEGYCLQCDWKYSEKIFRQDEKSQTHITLELEKGEDIIFHKITRQPEKEQELLQRMTKMGLNRLSGGSFELRSEETEETLSGETDQFFQLVIWLSENKNVLEQSGFEIAPVYWLGDRLNLLPVSLSWKVKKKNDWFDVEATVLLEGHEIPFVRFKDNILSGNRFYRLPDNSMILLPETWFKKYKEVFSFARQKGKTISLNRFQEPLLACFSESEKKLPSLKPPGKKGKGLLIEGLQAKLRDYQLQGLHWLNAHYRAGTGACLADEMGLGKTIQTLALLIHILNLEKERPKEKITEEALPNSGHSIPDLFSNLEPENEPIEPLRTLLVLPLSLIHNWKNEAARFAPQLKILIHAGTGRTTDPAVFRNYDLILTTYTTLRNDIQVFEKTPFRCIILDESQNIKNPLGKTYRSITRLSSSHRLALTGTPIENSLSDLWAQMNFLNPGMLGGFKSFREEFLVPIEKNNDEERRNTLQKLINPFILRRTIGQVASELPELTETIRYSEMAEQQSLLYEEEKARARNAILENLSRLGQSGTQLLILRSLTRLRQIANHPGLCFDNWSEPPGKYLQVTKMIHQLLENEHKILIFSQFVRHLEVYEGYCRENSLPFAKLTGSLSEKERQAQIARFQRDKHCGLFFISLKAGGTGLNLTQADHVFLLDPWWNPASESQAIGRSHRIGQGNKVFAYKFIAMQTVEEKIVQLQERKKELAAGLIPDPRQALRFSGEDIDFLLN